MTFSQIQIEGTSIGTFTKTQYQTQSTTAFKHNLGVYWQKLVNLISVNIGSIEATVLEKLNTDDIVYRKRGISFDPTIQFEDRYGLYLWLIKGFDWELWLTFWNKKINERV